MRKKRSILCLLLIAALLGAGCGSGPTSEGPLPAEEGDGLVVGEIRPAAVKVVATIFPLADIVRRIGGEGVEVTTLLAPGASPHTYEPTVEQARAVAGAELVVYIGGGLDDWAVKLAEGAPQVRLLEIMETLSDFLLDYEPLDLEEGEGKHGHTHDHEHSHHREKEDTENKAEHAHRHLHGPHDPHIWLDPLLVRDRVASLLQEKLAAVGPQWEETFQKNLEIFQEELTELHGEIAARTAAFRQRRFISYHSAWNYFARRYGLEEVAAVEQFPGKEPSARWMAELVKLAARHDIKVLFAEPQLGGNTAAVIAREMGGEVLLLDPLGGEEIPGRDSYIALLRYNADIMAQAMGGD